MFSLDHTDRTIISLLAENPESSQSEIAQKLRMSQPSIGARIRKLKKHGFIAHQVGVSITKTKTGIAKIDVYAKDSAKILENMKEKCPLFLNGFITSGRHNLCLFLVFEDISSVNACIDHDLRENPLVSDVEVSIVVSSAREVIVPMNLRPRKNKTSSCGRQCNKCNRYNSEQCYGCPNTIYYKGILFK